MTSTPERAIDVVGVLGTFLTAARSLLEAMWPPRLENQDLYVPWRLIDRQLRFAEAGQHLLTTGFEHEAGPVFRASMSAALNLCYILEGDADVLVTEFMLYQREDFDFVVEKASEHLKPEEIAVISRVGQERWADWRAARPAVMARVRPRRKREPGRRPDAWRSERELAIGGRLERWYDTLYNRLSNDTHVNAVGMASSSPGEEIFYRSGRAAEFGELIGVIAESLSRLNDYFKLDKDSEIASITTQAHNGIRAALKSIIGSP